MPPVRLQYPRSSAYERYLNDGRRPDSMLPELQTNRSGEVWIALGEVYCRYRSGTHNRLCSQAHEFTNTDRLRDHYRRHHRLAIETRTRGFITADEDRAVEAWYRDLVAGLMPTWNPRWGIPSTQPQPAPVPDPGHDHQSPASGDEEETSSEEEEPGVFTDYEWACSLLHGDVDMDDQEEGAQDDRRGTQADPLIIDDEDSSPLSKAESGSEAKWFDAEPFQRVHPPRLPNGQLNVEAMRAVCGVSPGFRCDYCVARRRECLSRVYYDSRCEVWTHFLNPLQHPSANGNSFGLAPQEPMIEDAE